MPNKTVNVPGPLLADFEAAIQASLGEDAEGLSSREQFVLFVSRGVVPHLRALRRRKNVDVSAEEAARTAKEAALAAETVARKAAEDTEDAQVDADVAGFA